MKAAIAAAATAVLAGAANALAGNHRHAHQLFAKRNADASGMLGATAASMCIADCTTIYSTYLGEPTLLPPPSTTSACISKTQTPASITVPTPVAHTCAFPSTCTFPATILTVTSPITVCDATTTADSACPTPIITPGTYTKHAVIVTATVTDFVTVCPFTGSDLPTSTTNSPVQATTADVPVEATIAPNVSAETPIPSQAPVPPPDSVTPSENVTPSSSTTSPESSASSSDVTVSPPVVGGKGSHYGITYGPYDNTNGACKTADQVLRDIGEIKKAGFQAVRIYGTDCNTVPHVSSACAQHGLEMIAGVFIKATDTTVACSINNPAVMQQVNDLKANQHRDLVKLLVVGNEAIFNKICAPHQLAQLIVDVKANLPEYAHVPFTISETVNIWQDINIASSLCPLVDTTGANIHPYFNPDLSNPSLAGDFVLGQMEILKKICNKPVINLECGWKADGACFGQACPGKENQMKAIQSIEEKCGGDVVFFAFDDERWKGADSGWSLAAVFNYLPF